MQTPNEGTGLSAELQGQVEELASTQQNSQLSQEQSGQTTETTETQQPDVTALQKELAELRQRSEQSEQRFKETQAAFTRSQQALRAYVGGQQAPQNPIEQMAQGILATGKITKDPEQARALAEWNYNNVVSPITQQLQSQQLAMHNQGQLDNVMRNLYTAHPQVMSDPSIYQAVENGLRQQALEYAREGQQWDSNSATEYGRIYAAQQYGLKQLSGNATHTPPQQMHPMQIRSQFGPMGNLSGPQGQQQKSQDTPEMIALQRKIESQFKLPTK